MNRREVRDYLFSDGDGSHSISAQINAACTEVSQLPERRLLETDVEALVQYFVEKYDVEIPTLLRDEIVASQHERQVEVWDHWDRQMRSVPGEAYDFEVPFQGEADIFKLRPSSFDFNPPRAQVRKQHLAFTIADRSLTPETIKAQLDSTLASIEKYLESHRRQWSGFKQQIENAVRAEIDARRTKLLAQKENASKLSGLGIRLKEKAGDARSYIPPTVKQKVMPQLPPMTPAIPPNQRLISSSMKLFLAWFVELVGALSKAHHARGSLTKNRSGTYSWYRLMPISAQRQGRLSTIKVKRTFLYAMKRATSL